ncbi:MAG: glycoside hydrolase family 3 N-terminal domain-containing protein [Anaerolineae bacterium]|jgi:beta-N-acetylhexosaminidase
MRKRDWLSLAITTIVTLGLTAPSLAHAVGQQQDDPAARLLERMSPADRVGQLFVVTFPGAGTDELSSIYSLITQERVGGVLLRPENGNIINEGDTPTQVATLTSNLQELAWEATQVPSPLPLEEESYSTPAPFVPLLIAVEQEGNGSPYTAIVSGTTPLPSPMAIGATWNPDHAETVGRIVGEELRALGINTLLGPSLDVLNNPRPSSAADLGCRSFGGDPYWVGQMGRSYVRGIHSGSEGQVGVIARHFPGLGAADRPLSEEVSTVQKSLEQLKQIELAPFFAVADTEEPVASADGFLVSHIRYRGFQGNIYASTKPVSFDPQALQQLMALPELAPWRESGGLTVADELGVRAVRRFYDPTEQEFNNLRIAREAFLAGNDLLILSHFALSDDWDSQIANVRATIAFFREKYISDPTFQARVDEAVLRILQLKLRLYGSPFLLSRVRVEADAAADLVGQGQEQVAPIAQDVVTLLSPPSPDLRPAPPTVDDQIVIFTDDRQLSPCDGCAPVYAIPPTLLADTLIRLYGPQATHQMLPTLVRSFTLSQLTDYLSTPTAPPSEGTPPPPHPVEAALERADWVIFAMLDIDEQVPASDAVRRFLAERADLLRDHKVVVLAFGAPYYLDTTEIAKLSAYFGLYSHTEPFVEAAARALFNEFPFGGAPPVSVPGINYDLISQTQPDPSQTIGGFIGDEPEGEEGTPQPTPELGFGDTLRLRTGVIVDRNGNPVPDGTPVEFIFTYPQEGLEHSVHVTTHNGVAETTLKLDRAGELQISVRAEPVSRVVWMEMDIPPEGEPGTTIAVTPTSSPIPPPTPTPTPVSTPDITPIPTQEFETWEEHPGRTNWSDLGQGMVGALLMALVGYGGLWRRRRDLSLALRGALLCAAGGLIAYIGLVLELPGTRWIQERIGFWTAGTMTLIGATVCLVAIVLKNELQDEQTVAQVGEIRKASSADDRECSI